MEHTDRITENQNKKDENLALEKEARKCKLISIRTEQNNNHSRG